MKINQPKPETESDTELTLEELIKTCTPENTKLNDEDRAWLGDLPKVPVKGK